MTERTWVPLFARRSLRYLRSLHDFIHDLSKRIQNNAGMYRSVFKNAACAFLGYA